MVFVSTPTLVLDFTRKSGHQHLRFLRSQMEVSDAKDSEVALGKCAAEDGARDSAKGGGVLREECAMKYAFIEAHRARYPVPAMCELLEVSRSGYHA
jgi:hypothetical protein